MNFLYDLCSIKFFPVYIFLLFILDAFFSGRGNLFADLDPAFIEVIKIVFVSVGWTGGLILFILRKEKYKAKPAHA